MAYYYFFGIIPCVIFFVIAVIRICIVCCVNRNRAPRPNPPDEQAGLYYAQAVAPGAPVNPPIYAQPYAPPMPMFQPTAPPPPAMSSQPFVPPKDGPPAYLMGPSAPVLPPPPAYNAPPYGVAHVPGSPAPTAPPAYGPTGPAL
eukprot:gnl/Trimastix_PCT/4380.p1 GENE.gnl/Trimastix_PCT/4380~~gnl/Trimastix_PCT/4380.p1  ORF type:complete len:159 (-),score=2.73 gnl/Trimastix_PCT/4380:87-518(-)